MIIHDLNPMVGLEKAIDPIKKKQCITHIWETF